MRRAIGIIRVSRVGGREGESFASPDEQRDRIEQAAERDGLQLVRIEEELDVSGGTPLERRTGLRSAVEAVEAAEADVIVGAYFDRLVRSLTVQSEVVQRVEKAGGSVLALDVGEVTEGSAGQWLSGTMLGAVAEYQRRTTRERVAGAQRRAIERGVPILKHIPPGYTRGPDKRLVTVPEEVPVVREAFEMRAAGASIKDILMFMRENGIERSFRSVQSMLASRVYLGEVNYGELSNAEAHEPIIDPDLFRVVQNIIVSRGRYAKSDALLARQGILVCGTCGRCMSINSRGGRNDYRLYRCTRLGDCERRVAISAEIVEEFVIQRVRKEVAEINGSASADTRLREAEADLSAAQQRLDGAILALADLGGEASSRETLEKLRATRDEAQERVGQAGGTQTAITLNADRDWDALTLDEQRSLLRATISRVVIAPGKPGGRHTASTDRITVEMFG